MQVTRRPQALRTTPTLLAVTPLPSPLTTPPVISTYLVAAAVGCSPGGEDMRKEEGERELRFRGEKSARSPRVLNFICLGAARICPGLGFGPGSGLWACIRAELVLPFEILEPRKKIFLYLKKKKENLP